VSPKSESRVPCVRARPGSPGIPPAAANNTVVAVLTRQDNLVVMDSR